MSTISSDTLLTSIAPGDARQANTLGAHLANLQAHVARCHDVAEAQLPKLVLSACQAIYNFEPVGAALIERKCQVFDSIRSGSTMAAIRAVLPERISAHCSPKRDGAFAVLQDRQGTYVQAQSSSPERALLAGVLQLAIACHARSHSWEQPLALFSMA